MDSSEDLGDIEFPPGVKDVSSDMNPSELVKALKKCCKFFSQLEQDEEKEKRQYLPFCRYIVQDEFIKEIRDGNCCVHIGCILADILRLYAPDNPFHSNEKIKDIFMFLTEQLARLKDSKGPLFPKAYHILDNVATIKSYNICLDLDVESAGEVFTSLFRTLLSTVNSGHDKQLKLYMLDIMSFAISDSGSISQPVLDILLESLLDKSQKMNPSAFELAKEVLRRTASVVEQHLMILFQNVIFANKQDCSRVSAHWSKLIPILYNITPSLLLNTLPQLELKLRVDDAKERLQMAKLLSAMFSEKDSDVASQYTNLWNCFLGRFNDIDSDVRTTCVSFCRALIVNRGRESALTKEVIPFLKSRRHDTDENVRLAVVSCIRGIAMSDLHLTSDELLDCLKERVLDKKWKVREAAIRAMADVYKKYATGSTRIHLRRLQSFRSRLLHVYYRQNLDDCLLLERVMVSSLVPYTLSDAERMKHMLELYATVDDNAVKAIIEMLKKQRSVKMALREIVEAFKLDKEEDRNNTIWPKVVLLSTMMSGSPQVARDNVKKFVRIAFEDQRIKQLLAYILSDSYKSQKVASVVRDLLKKLETDGVAKTVRTGVQQILERAVITPVLIDPPSLKILFEMVKESLDGVSDVDELNTEDAQCRSVELLRTLSQLAPQLFVTQECYEDLLGLVRRTRDEYVIDQALIMLRNTAPIIEDRFAEIRTVLLPELKSKAKMGTRRQAKHAVFCIHQLKSVANTALISVFDHCKEAVMSDDTTPLQMQTLLTTLGCIADVIPDKVAPQLRNVVASVVVKQVIMKTTQSSSASSSRGKKKDSKWCEKSEISRESQAKIAGMKCMVRWLHGLRSNDFDCCGSTLRLLQHMLHNDGDLMKSGDVPKSDMCHLRLQAASCILRIARCSEYKDLFKPELYQELAMMINDSVLEVRRTFVNKLYQSLFRFQIHISYLALFALVSQETLKEQRELGTFLYHQLVKRIRDFNKQTAIGASLSNAMMPEYMLPYLVYLLASDPDFLDGISKRSLSRIKDCIQFILDPLLTKDHPESFGFVKRLAENLKRTKNSDQPDDRQRNENVYAVCDLIVQHVLQRSSQHAVGIIEPNDKSIMRFIPSKLYTAPSGAENNQVYLPREFYVNVKSVPTPSYPTASSSRGGAAGRMKKNQVIQKLAPVVVASDASRTTTTSQLTTSQSSVEASSASSSASLTSSSSKKREVSSLPTPPTSHTDTSQESGKSTDKTLALPLIKSSGRKRRPLPKSPSPLPSLSSAKRAKTRQTGRSAHSKKQGVDDKGEDSMGDQASGSESDDAADTTTSTIDTTPRQSFVKTKTASRKMSSPSQPKSRGRPARKPATVPTNHSKATTAKAAKKNKTTQPAAVPSRSTRQRGKRT